MRAILVALFSIAVALNVYAQSPKQKQPLPKSDAAQHDTKPDERGTNEAPLIIKVLPPPDEAEKTAADKQERQDKSKSDWSLVGLTGVLAVIGVAQIIVFSIQAYRLRQTVDEMKIATKATEKAAAAAMKSAELARDEFTATYCPRLIIRRVRIYQAADVPFEVHYEIANIGGTRARIVEISARLWMPDIKKSFFPSIPPYAMGDKCIEIFVESGAPYRGRHIVVLSQEIEEHALRLSFTEGVFSQGQSKDAYFLGYIVYLDLLNRRFETAFLREYDFHTKRFSPVNDPDYEYLA